MKRTLFIPLLLVPIAALAEPLSDYIVLNARIIPAPLTDWSGDPAPGEALFATAGCAGCHDGTKAPDLADVKERMSEGEIRLAIVEPRILWPETDMPAYYEPGKSGEVEDELVGRTRLSALEVEQLVAYLKGSEGQ